MFGALSHPAARPRLATTYTPRDLAGRERTSNDVIQLNKREAALILAAIRNWQEELASLDLYDLYEGYFEDVDPLSQEEMDDLCSRIAAVSQAAEE
jgi:hypothetical protein